MRENDDNTQRQRRRKRRKKEGRKETRPASLLLLAYCLFLCTCAHTQRRCRSRGLLAGSVWSLPCLPLAVACFRTTPVGACRPRPPAAQRARRPPPPTRAGSAPLSESGAGLEMTQPTNQCCVVWVPPLAGMHACTHTHTHTLTHSLTLSLTHSPARRRGGTAA